MSKAAKNICILPWLHLNIHPSGDVTPCCHTDLSKPYANVDGKSVNDILNNALFKQLRKEFMNGERPEICSTCFKLEDASIPSPRQWHNKVFDHHMPLIEATNEDGGLSKVDIHSLDVRMSNVCNFSCRGCYPKSSSSWAEDFEKLTGKTVTKKLTTVNSQTVKELLGRLDTVEKIYFAGGEPFLMSETYELLEKLKTNGQTKVELSFSTNLSTLKLNHKSILESLSTFEDITLYMSIDDIGKRGEYFRKGLELKKFEKNLAEVRKHLPHAKCVAAITINIMNVSNLDKISDYIINQLGFSSSDFLYNFLTVPKELNAQNLPKESRKEIIHRLEKFQSEYVQGFLKTLPFNDVAIAKKNPTHYKFLDQVINFLKVDGDETLLKDFFSYTEAIDLIRDENYEELFPELVSLKHQML